MAIMLTLDTERALENLAKLSTAELLEQRSDIDFNRELFKEYTESFLEGHLGLQGAYVSMENAISDDGLRYKKIRIAFTAVFEQEDGYIYFSDEAFSFSPLKGMDELRSLIEERLAIEPLSE